MARAASWSAIRTAAVCQRYRVSPNTGMVYKHTMVEIRASCAKYREISPVIANGDIVVALVHNEEATIKYLFKEVSSLRLDPATRDSEPQIFGPDEVQIQGKMAGLLRRYN